MNRTEYVSHVFEWTPAGCKAIIAEYDRLTVEVDELKSAVEVLRKSNERLAKRKAQLLDALKKAQSELRATQINWQEECLFEADDIMTAAIRAAEEEKCQE